MNTGIQETSQPGATADDRQINRGLVLIAVVCLLPYVGIGPFSAPSQIQPWAGLLAWLWVAYRAMRTGIKITGFQWALLLFATFFMLNVYGGAGFDLAVYLRRSGAYLLSAGIFLACQYLTPATLWVALKLTVPVWLGFGLLRYVDSGTYYAIVTPLVPTVFSSNVRGSSSLAPEATDFGFTMVFIVVLCLITRQRLKQQGRIGEKWPLYGAIASALISLSGTGYIGLAVVGAIHVLSGPAVKFGIIGRTLLAVLFAAATFATLSILPSQSVRGLELIRVAVQDPYSLMNTTTSYRVVHGAVGVLGIKDSEYIGYGAGSFQTEAPGVYYRHHLGEAFNLANHYEQNVPATLRTNPSSHVAVMLLEFGLFAVLYLGLIFTFASRSKIPLKGIAVAVLALAWLGSFPASWPPFWVVIGIMMSPHFASSTNRDPASTQRRRPRIPRSHFDPEITDKHA